MLQRSPAADGPLPRCCGAILRAAPAYYDRQPAPPGFGFTGLGARAPAYRVEARVRRRRLPGIRLRTKCCGPLCWLPCSWFLRVLRLWLPSLWLPWLLLLGFPTVAPPILAPPASSCSGLLSPSVPAWWRACSPASSHCVLPRFAAPDVPASPLRASPLRRCNGPRFAVVRVPASSLRQRVPAS